MVSAMLSMVSDGDLHCTTLMVFSSSFSGFLSSSFVPFSLFKASSFFVVWIYVWTGEFCEDWLWDRLLLPPSGVCRGSCCSEDMRNLFKLSLRTSECDFFFFFFRLALENTSVINFDSFSSPSRCECCWDISEVEENRESGKIAVWKLLLLWTNKRVFFHNFIFSNVKEK